MLLWFLILWLLLETDSFLYIDLYPVNLLNAFSFWITLRFYIDNNVVRE